MIHEPDKKAWRTDKRTDKAATVYSPFEKHIHITGKILNDYYFRKKWKEIVEHSELTF